MKRLLAATLLAAGLFASCASNEEAAPAKTNDTTVFDDIAPNRIAATLSPGWNLGNQLEGVKIVTTPATGEVTTTPSETVWAGTLVTQELLHAVKAAGFRFVRIPVSYFSYLDDANGYQIKPEWLARIQQVVDWCVAEGLYCMINVHGDGYTSIANGWLLVTEKDQKPILAKYSALWKQLAETFRDYDESVLFESMNEVFDGQYNGPNAEGYEAINAYNEAFVKTVRSTGGHNAKRWLLIPGWNTDIDATVNEFGAPGRFRMPKDERLMVSVHYYEPWGFCGGENGNATQWGSFATKPNKANGTEISMAKQFNKLRDTFTSKGIPVVIGEWGSIDKSADDPDSNLFRAYFARKLSENALRTGCVPVIWDNAWNGKYGFAIFHRGDKADAAGNIHPGTVAVSQPGIVDAIMSVYAPPAVKKSAATVALSVKELSMTPEEVKIIDADVQNATGPEPVTWSSSDETVAVIWDGILKAVGAGSAQITARLGNGKTATADVKVGVAGGVLAKVYCFEGKGWSAVKSDPILIKEGIAGTYEVQLKASEIVLTNIAALYLKDVEVEENHAEKSEIKSTVVTVTRFSVNGVDIPLIKNVDVEGVNGKGQLDLPLINEWNPAIEMVAGFPRTGHRDLTSVVKNLKLKAENNTIVIQFKTSGKEAVSTQAAAPKPTLDPAKTYHAYFGLQVTDTWVFRNAWSSPNLGGDSPEFQGGLFDLENAVSADGKVPGVIVDSSFTQADLEAGKTITVSCTGFNLSDKGVTAAALNFAMISTDVPYGLIQVTDAKLFFDGKQVNVKDGQNLFLPDLDNGYLVINFLNIWNKAVKTFGYTLPTKEIRMEFRATVAK